MFAEGGDDPMHSSLLGDGEFWDAWSTFYLREPGDGVLLGTRPRDEFLKLLSTRFNVDASVPCTCKANVPTTQSPDNIVLLRFEKGVALRIQSVMPRSNAMHLWSSWLKLALVLELGWCRQPAPGCQNIPPRKADWPLSTNRWKPTDSTLRTLRTEVSIDYPESSDSSDEVHSLSLEKRPVALIPL